MLFPLTLVKPVPKMMPGPVARTSLACTSRLEPGGTSPKATIPPSEQSLMELAVTRVSSRWMLAPVNRMPLRLQNNALPLTSRERVSSGTASTASPVGAAGFPAALLMAIWPRNEFSRMLVSTNAPARPMTALLVAASPNRMPVQRCNKMLLLFVKNIAGCVSPSIAEVASVSSSIVTPAEPSTTRAGPRPE